MEPVSLAVSVASLASLFSLCLQGYSSVRMAKNLGEDATTFICQFEIEEARFIIWGRGAGFLPTLDGMDASEVDIPFEHAGAVSKVLGQISKLMGDVRELRQRYGIVVEDAVVSTGQGNAEFIGGLQTLRERFSVECRRQSKFATSLQQSASFLKKVRWVLTDKDTLGSLIDTLRGFNDSLLSMQSTVSRRKFQQDFQALCLESAKTNDLVRLQVIQNTGYKPLALPASHKVLRLRLELEYTERFDVSIDVGAKATSWPVTDLSALKIAREKVYIEHMDAPRSLGRYQSQNVVVEWRDLKESPTYATSGGQVLHRLQLLSKLLHVDTPRPPEFRSLGCFGFLFEPQPPRFAFIFALPSTAATAATAESLYDVLCDEDRTRPRPSQTSRFKLARHLASSLLHLHATGWLHKGVRSRNILLFGSRSSVAEVSALIEEPFLVGHGYARLAANAAGTEPVRDGSDPHYRHPDLSDESSRPEYRRQYDIYALGVLLIEIAYWKPLHKLVSSRRSAEEGAGILREIVISGDLAHWMGCVYSDAVKWCFECQWRDSEVDFFENVVKSLETCVV